MRQVFSTATRNVLCNLGHAISIVTIKVVMMLCLKMYVMMREKTASWNARRHHLSSATIIVLPQVIALMCTVRWCVMRMAIIVSRFVMLMMVPMLMRVMRKPLMQMLLMRVMRMPLMLMLPMLIQAMRNQLMQILPTLIKAMRNLLMQIKLKQMPIHYS